MILLAQLLVGFVLIGIGIGIAGLVVGYVYTQDVTELTDEDQITSYRVSLYEAYMRSRQ